MLEHILYKIVPTSYSSFCFNYVVIKFGKDISIVKRRIKSIEYLEFYKMHLSSCVETGYMKSKTAYCYLSFS